MDDAGWTNTPGKELGVNSNVGASIHDDSVKKRSPSQQLPLCAVSVNLEAR